MKPHVRRMLLLLPFGNRARKLMFPAGCNHQIQPIGAMPPDLRGLEVGRHRPFARLDFRSAYPLATDGG